MTIGKYFLTALLGFVLLCPFANAQKHQDCRSAMKICKKTSYTIERVGGIGANDDTDFTPCFIGSFGRMDGQAEENSTWIRFKVEQPGTLAFAIKPTIPSHDIDFVVYLLPDGNCRNKQIVRCMAAGDPEEEVRTSKCLGQTGLRDSEKDSSEDAGCSDPGDNAWLAPLRVAAGEEYVILVSNVTASGPGFSISFSGSCKLECDEEPIAEAPKPKPPKTKPTPPKPTVQIEPAPGSIGGRPVEVDETIKVKKRIVKIRIRDNQVEDGDVVSIYLNENKILSNITLRTQPQEFEITLPANKKEHYITVFAEDFGRSGGANTALVEIDDGANVQTIDLIASKSKQQSVKLIVQ